MSDMQPVVQFQCPKCGSYMFGSSNCTGGGVLTRLCHGNEAWQCGFQFPHTDDWKYFVKVTEKGEEHFTQAEWEAYEKAEQAKIYVGTVQR